MHNYSLAQSDAKGKKVSVIIPLFNERETILEVIKAVESVPLDLEKEIIIVDDGSKDGSREVVRSLDSKYKVILKEKNEGKGSALKVGIVHSLGDYVIFQDADLEYDPNDYAKLLAPLEKNEADLVLGSRVLSGSMRLFGPKRVHFATFFGCKLIAFFINTLYGYRFTDYYGCYKSFRRETLTSVDVRAREENKNPIATAILWTKTGKSKISTESEVMSGTTIRQARVKPYPSAVFMCPLNDHAVSSAI